MEDNDTSWERKKQYNKIVRDNLLPKIKKYEQLRLKKYNDFKKKHNLSILSISIFLLLIILISIDIYVEYYSYNDYPIHITIPLG